MNIDNLKIYLKIFKDKCWIGAIPAMLGVVILCSKTITVYAEMPQKVAKIEEYIQQQQRSNEIQAKANDLMQQIITKDKEVVESEPIIFSPDGKKWWDVEKKEWRPIKELKKKEEVADDD